MKKACKTEDKEKLKKWSQKAKYACSRCGSESKKEKHLCKPEKI